jgi:hypothetical protein
MTIKELRSILLPYADHVEIGVQNIATGEIAAITGVRLVDMNVPDPLYGTKPRTVLLATVHVWQKT